MKVYDEAYNQALNQAKQAFRSGERTLSDLDVEDHIAESWGRCVKYRIDPKLSKLSIVLDPEMQSALGQLRPLLFEMIRTRLKKMNEQGYFPSMGVFCASMDGYITYVTGDKRLVEMLAHDNIQAGTDINEYSSGTNAAALCIQLFDMVEICGEEHYLDMFCPYNCIATPFYDHNNKQVAVLGLISDKPFDTPFPRILLKLVASNLRRIGQLHYRYIDLADFEAYLEQLMHNMEYGVLLVNNRRQIIKANTVARSIFMGTNHELIGQQIEKLILPSYIDFSGIENSIENIPVVISSLHYNASVYFIAAHQWQDKKYIVVLRRPTAATVKKNKKDLAVAQYHFSDIIGQSLEIRQAIQHARIATGSPVNVLITGESGTGKELFAQSIHNENSYYTGPFVAINCGAIPKHLIESELFGYVAGAFTGARKGGAPGKIESADGGTLFLDEIGDMPLELQVTLLRFLQNREFTRVGGTNVIHVDVRVIAATNKNLELEIEQGHFRADLYYRLNLLNIHIPSLRDRRQDIPMLAEHFLRKHQDILKVTGFTPQVSQILYNYDWPGNIRELENTIAHAVLMAERDLIDVACLPERLRTISSVPMNVNTHPYILTQTKSIQEVEREAIQQMLFATGGNIRIAAEKLGMSKRTLYRRIKEYNIFYQK